MHRGLQLCPVDEAHDGLRSHWDDKCRTGSHSIVTHHPSRFEVWVDLFFEWLNLYLIVQGILPGNWVSNSAGFKFSQYL